MTTDANAYYFFGVAAATALIVLFSLLREGWRLSTRLFALGLLLVACQCFCWGRGIGSATALEKAGWENLRLMVYAVSPFTWLAFSLCYGRENGREFLRRWRGALAANLIVPTAAVVLFRGRLVAAIFRGAMDKNWTYTIGLGAFVLYLTWLLTAMLVMMNLEHTVRSAIGTMRWRVKYTVMGLGAFFCVDAYTSSQVLLSRSIDSSLQAADAVALLLGCAMMVRSIWRRGAQATVLPSSAVWQGSVTLFVGGIYLVVIGVLAKLVAWAGAEKSFSFKAFVILVSFVCITVLALSDRARLRVRQFISRYFQTPMYDYRAVWRNVMEQVATHVDETEICQSAVTLVSKSFDVLSTSIWMLDEKKENLLCVASTLLSETVADGLRPTPKDAQEVIRRFRHEHDPVTLEKSRDKWAETLRKCHPAEFRTGGDRVCVPLAAGKGLLGVMLLGDRVDGMSFSLQDFDLLRCVADQIAAALLNARLSTRLLQTREMEAFQAMSTFFVHDLKNLASTLNLMLKNLPVHFDNPEFRADALRGIGKTCDHINHLISRLSLLRESLQIRPLESDLNKIVAAALANCPPTPGVVVKQQLPSLPKVMLDAEQIDKVITNLALNAIEAVPAGGQIAVETSHHNGWAVVTVADTGCGMEPEFVSRSLFRPFQTTKKKGLGIGMFQSKMIVEAHGGRIEVESQRGKGSTFRVLLPLQKTAT